MKLEGKIALVTGGSRGIGFATCKKLASEGATIIITDICDEEKAAPAIKELEDMGAKAKFYKSDVSNFESAQETVNAVIKDFGGLDILVNNAGVSDSTPLDKYTSEQFANIMQLNVNSIMNGILPTVKIMKEQGYGCILNTSSMVSLCGQRSGIGYPTSKSAVNGLTWSLARELGPFNIRVNAVAPGITNTDMVSSLPKGMIEPLKAAIPLRRVGEPEDIANAFLFLASDMASYVTGEILSVDGAMRT